MNDNPARPSGKRWKAVIKLRNGEEMEAFFEEIHELEPIIEGGPDWRLIREITVTYQRGGEL